MVLEARNVRLREVSKLLMKPGSVLSVVVVNTRNDWSLSPGYDAQQIGMTCWRLVLGWYHGPFTLKGHR